MKKMSTEKIINKICAELPPGWTIELCMAGDEIHGRTPWINLIDPQSRYPSLLDSSNKTIAEQLEDALHLAKERARI